MECPRCKADVYSHDLSSFVRFYDGDEGYCQCRSCGLLILWTMKVKPR